jgi:hypothetical protein
MPASGQIKLGSGAYGPSGVLGAEPLAFLQSERRAANTIWRGRLTQAGDTWHADRMDIFRVVPSRDGRQEWVIEHTKAGDDSFGTYCTTEVEAEAYAKWMTAQVSRQKVLCDAS